MAFVPNSRITIGGFRFSGVHEIRIKKSIFNYIDTATIQLPARVKVKHSAAIDLFGDDKDAEGFVTTDSQFTEGDRVRIELGYDGRLTTEFEGFVRRKSMGMPLEIECEGYGRLLRLNNNISGTIAKTNVNDLLRMAVGEIDIKGNKLTPKRTDIEIVCPDKMPIVNMKLTHATGADIIDAIKRISLDTFTAFFISPKVLWCGLTYTPYKDGKDAFGNGVVAYRLGYNCIKDNNLKQRIPSEPVQVILNGTYATGQRVQTKSEANYAARKDAAILNNVVENDWRKKLANEKQYQANYTGYQGYITSLLNPDCQPGFVATITNKYYPKLNGKYVVESTEVQFGVNGCKRRVEIGPKVGFKTV